jgi:Major Facilitator Superfamily.
LIPYTVGYGIFFGAVLLLPLWLQNWFGYTATWAGLVAAPSGLVAVILAAIFGKHFGRVDARTLATIGFVSFAASYLMRAAMTPDASFFWFVLPGLVQGVGMAVFFVAMINIMLEGVAPRDIPAASGLSNFVRITAGSFAASIVTTFWDRDAAVHQTHLAEATSAWDPRMQHALETLQSQGLSETQSLGALTHTLNSQAYFLSALDYFWISGVLTLAFIAFVWLTRRPQGGHAAAAE